MKEGLRGENQQKKLSEELKYPVVKENEIILDVQTASTLNNMENQKWFNCLNW